MVDDELSRFKRTQFEMDHTASQKYKHLEEVWLKLNHALF